MVQDNKIKGNLIKSCINTFIIAEAGVNHNGNIKTAFKLVDAAKEAKVNAVKFQTFKTENLVSSIAEKAQYQVQNTGNDESQYSMLKELELSYNDFKLLKEYTESRGLIFISTPFDLESVDFLEGIGMPLWKVPSGEITNLPYLIKIAETKKPIILSTGMCSMDDIENAINSLNKYDSGDISILHCTTEYPAPLNEVNLLAIDTLKKKFNLRVGYSDHTQGIEISIAAVAMGATILEKHFTLDKNMEGPDHKASLEPEELKRMVEAVRNVEKALGDGIKLPSKSELKNIDIARKSIIAKCNIKKGEVFTEENITAKRPGNGISPMKWFEVLGRTAGRDFIKDELIEI